MSTVRIPPVLRAQAGGAKTVDVGGATVGEILAALVAAHPALGPQLFTDEGALNRFVNVYVDGQDVRYTGELATAVAERDDEWAAPRLWRSELMSTLAGYVRCGESDIAGAVEFLLVVEAGPAAPVL